MILKILNMGYSFHSVLANVIVSSNYSHAIMFTFRVMPLGKA